MPDSNPYVVVGSPSYATPLVNLFGSQGQQQGQGQGGQQGQGQQPGQGGLSNPQNYAAFAQTLAKMFGVGPYATAGGGKGGMPGTDPYYGTSAPTQPGALY